MVNKIHNTMFMTFLSLCFSNHFLLMLSHMGYDECININSTWSYHQWSVSQLHQYHNMLQLVHTPAYNHGHHQHDKIMDLTKILLPEFCLCELHILQNPTFWSRMCVKYLMPIYATCFCFFMGIFYYIISLVCDLV